MDRLKRISQTIYALSLALSVVAAQQADSRLAKKGFPFGLGPVVALVIVGLGRPAILSGSLLDDGSGSSGLAKNQV
jgi:hypothetical protein